MHATLNQAGSNNAAAKINAGLWIMFIICFLGMVMAGSVSTLMSVYLPVIVRELMGYVDEGRLSHLSSFINALFIAGWTVGGFSWGAIADRIGRAKSLAIAVSIFGLFTLLTAFVPSGELLMTFRFLAGFGVGGTLVLNTTLLSETWPEKTKAIFIGFLSIGFPVGIISSGLINYMITDWRMAFMIGFYPLAIGISSFWFLRESEKWKMSRNTLSEGNIKLIFNDNHRNLINGSIIFGSMLIGLWAVFSWIPTWIQSLMAGLDSSHERGLSMMLLGAGGLTGGFFSGWISNLLGTRKAMLICFAGCFILSVLLFKFNLAFSPVIYIEIAALSFLFGISQGLLSFYIPLLFPVSIRATSTGFCFNTGRIFTFLAVFFVGWMVIALGGYGHSLFSFSFVFLIGFLVLTFSKNLTT